MKVKNLEVSIKIGNKQHKFTNLILNKYLDLFADSFLEFKDKNLDFCCVNLTNEKTLVTAESTEMLFDTILEFNSAERSELLTENTVINKYNYENSLAGYPPLSSFIGQYIKQIGFGIYDYEAKKFELYAYLDVSKYNIVVQEGQPIVISRMDKISTDMNFWSNANAVKCPYHLTTKGLLEVNDYEYDTVIPKLYSIGFGALPYKFTNEYLVEDLDISKTGVGEITIDNVLNNYAKNDLFPREDLYPRPDLYPQEGTANLLIYKFKLFRKLFTDPEQPPMLQDTGLFYVQYKQLERFGQITKLKIRYERG